MMDALEAATARQLQQCWAQKEGLTNLAQHSGEVTYLYPQAEQA